VSTSESKEVQKLEIQRLKHFISNIGKFNFKKGKQQSGLSMFMAAVIRVRNPFYLFQGKRKQITYSQTVKQNDTKGFRHTVLV